MPVVLDGKFNLPRQSKISYATLERTQVSENLFIKCRLLDQYVHLMLLRTDYRLGMLCKIFVGLLA
jgi:hypothetical protein